MTALTTGTAPLGALLILLASAAAAAAPLRAPEPPARPVMALPDPRPSAALPLDEEAAWLDGLGALTRAPAPGLRGWRAAPDGSLRVPARAETMRARAAPAAPAALSVAAAPIPSDAAWDQGFQSGRAAMLARRWAQAAATFRALAERRPDLPRPRLALARAAAMAGDCAAARSELTRVEPQRSRLAPGAFEDAEADVAARCGPRREWSMAFDIDMGLPGEDRPLAAPPPALFDLAGPRVAARMTAAPADRAWSVARLEVTERLRGEEAAYARFARFELMNWEDAPARAVAALGGEAAADAMRASGEIAADLGADWQALRASLTQRVALGPGRDAAAVEFGAGAEARAAEAGDRSARAELRLAAEAQLTRRARMRAEAAHAVARAGWNRGAVQERSTTAALTLARAAPAAGPAAQAELFAAATLAEPADGDLQAAAWRAGARLSGLGPDAAAAAELGVGRHAIEEPGPSVWMILSRSF
ncbi:hypothetical protein P2H44_13150 [Albimonas sp. CAU 1670]|uniref:hypothetical protein n=1 Tax=Albimonas sp. CAU 1670 TaxID=3032599 RepID=UPI0023DB62EA|nr:hypothetical protein [Albimonas sp. CAU 1670]MDF2233501.1 hypothetical protein [Albimonas sp. CAU 1670]